MRQEHFTKEVRISFVSSAGNFTVKASLPDREVNWFPAIQVIPKML
jgi:hypothetical protein